MLKDGYFRSSFTAYNPTPYAVALLVIAFLLFRVTRRVFRSYHGTRFSLSRTYAYTAVYVILGVSFSGLSYTEGVPTLLAIPELVLAAAAALGAYFYSDRRISFWKAGDGSLFFRGGVFIYIIYLVGLLVRLSIDIVLIGPSALTFTPGVVLTGVGLTATMATDLLLISGVGLLIGRGARVARRYGRISRGEEKVPDSPPPR
jgi:hypothetical protein